MLSRGSTILSRVASCVEATGSEFSFEFIRGISSSSSCFRMLRQPLPPSRPPGTLDGAEKSQLVDAYLSLENASRSSRIHANLQNIREQFQRFPGDTGSTEVQVAALTARIASVAEHLAVHRKDHNSRKGLRAMLNARRSLLQYLRRTKFDAYAVLISRLGLKDNYAPQDRFSVRYKAAIKQSDSTSSRGLPGDDVIV